MALIIRQAVQDSLAIARGANKAAWLVVLQDDGTDELSAWSTAPIDVALTVPVGVPIADPSVPTVARDTAKDISGTAAGQGVLDAYRQLIAQQDATDIPGWATWTEAEAVAWIDANVTDLATAKQALTAMARMLVALRNDTWPNLEGSA